MIRAKKVKLIIIISIMLSSFIIMFGLFGWFGNKGGETSAYYDNLKANADKTIYQFTLNDIDGKPVKLSDFKGKTILIVNVASKCGYTGQYEELQAFYEKNKSKDFVILGIPANNFMGQEPGSDEEIKSFCSKNYGVTFPMFSKISVKGKDMDPLYQFLTEKEKNGVMDAPVKWNFQKYLIDKEGHLVTFFGSSTKVTDKEFTDVVAPFLN